MAKIYLALGSNVGDRASNLKKAIELLRRKIQEIKLSLVYETKPVGYEKQDNFLNMVLEGKTELSPIQLLEFVKQVEKDTGRIRRFNGGPREIDVDILFYDDLIYHDGQLDIPHPRLHERDFVLRPLMDLNPEIIHPIYKKAVGQLYSEIPKNDLSILGDGRKLN
ncbi:MAG: 2-amino-4-hydroxy-6-hydroxymethyldihydropteridine diphosphokinase [Nitrososphaeria archaeon]|jgi:2-amino-4-hydroxy-6-hydroxymethyldihydropteridine diphosphokinase